MINVIAEFETSLASGISKTSTSGVLLSNVTSDNDGATIPNGDYGVVLDERNSKREYAIITVSGFNFTFVKRGVSMIDGNTEKDGNKFDHRKGSTIKITTHPIITLMVNAFNGNVPLGGVLILPAVRTINNPRHIVDKEYADSISVAGVIASSTSLGNSKLSSNPSVANNPIALNSEEVSANAGANKVVRSNSNSKISGDFISDNSSSGLETGSNGGSQIKIKSAGGIIKDNNGLSIDSGTTANKILSLDNNAKIPAVDGSQLTALPSISNVCIASDTLKISADNISGSSATTYVKVKEIKINISGTVRVKFDLGNGGLHTAFGRIYKNGVAVGTERSSSTDTYTTYSEDIQLAPGDLLQIYAHTSADTSRNANIQNFRLYYDKSVQGEYVINQN
jgi:hypothetical protein